MGAQLPDKPTVREIVADPHWLIRDVMTAFIIGALLAAGTVIGTKLVDDRRAERELNAVLVANRNDLQLENLRFVRSRSLDTRDSARRFAELDLAGHNLVGLPLPGSDFTRADLTGADLRHADLTGATLARATLTDISYDSETVWPQGFVPPPPKP